MWTGEWRNKQAGWATEYKRLIFTVYSLILSSAQHQGKIITNTRLWLRKEDKKNLENHYQLDKSDHYEFRINVDPHFLKQRQLSKIQKIIRKKVGCNSVFLFLIRDNLKARLLFFGAKQFSSFVESEGFTTSVVLYDECDLSDVAGRAFFRVPWGQISCFPSQNTLEIFCFSFTFTLDTKYVTYLCYPMSVLFNGGRNECKHR